MPSEGTDDGDNGEERTYQEYRRTKARADLHDDHDRPRDPAAEMLRRRTSAPSWRN